jgi:hypothetical protein
MYDDDSPLYASATAANEVTETLNRVAVSFGMGGQ